MSAVPNTDTYNPISSVWDGRDPDLIEQMLQFYAVIPPDPILDATYNSGRFWSGSDRRSNTWHRFR